MRRIYLRHGRSKGQAVLTYVAVAALIAVITLGYYLLMRQTRTLITLKNVEDYEKLAVRPVDVGKLLVENIGSSPATILRIWIRNISDGSVSWYTLSEMVQDKIVISCKLNGEDLYPASDTISLGIGDYLELEFNTSRLKLNMTRIAIETILDFYGWEYIIPEGYWNVTQMPPGLSGSIISLNMSDNALNMFEIEQGCIKAVRGILDHIGLLRNNTFLYRKNVDFKVEGSFEFGFLGIGYDKTYGGMVIVFTVRDYTGGVGPSIEYEDGGKAYLDIGYRVVIRGFKARSEVYGPGNGIFINNINVTNKIGLYFFSYFEGEDSKINLIQGHAARIEVFEPDQGLSEAPYSNYMVFGDFDGNGLAEMIFCDISLSDTSHLSGSVLGNDRISSYVSDDYSEGPYIMILKDYGGRSVISGANYIRISLRIKFFDNALDDTELNEISPSEPVLWISVYEVGENGNLTEVYRHELTYQELTLLENTDPPLCTSKVVEAIFPISSNKKYVVGIAFQDPYNDVSAFEFQNDADILVGIEFINIELYT